MSTTKQSLLILVFVSLYALLAIMPASGQSVTGTISGTVIDPTGALVPQATVTLTEERTGDVRKLTTNADGRFVFTAVRPEAYTIRVERQGFEALLQKNVVLSANENLALGQMELKTGQVTESVVVTASGGKVETESSDLTGRLTADQISLISTKGRDITSLLRLVPGTSYIDDTDSVGDGFGTDLPNISGQRGRSTVSSIDGLNSSEPSGSNKLSMTVNQDAIAEVKVLRNNYAAEYGNNGGAMINLITKSGGRAYHGTAYYFLRNEALNANDYFFNNASAPRPFYRHNIWGVTLGGPVQIPFIYPNHDRKKLFFFYSYEQPHTTTPQGLRKVTVPTALERQGDFSQSVNSTNQKVFITDPTQALSGTCNATTQTACFKDPSRGTPANPAGLNIIPAARFNPSGLAILNYFPLPNQSTSTFNYIAQRSVDVPKWSQIIRIDFQLSDRDSFNAKGQWWTADNEGFDTSGWPGGDNNRWGISSHYLYKDNGMSAGWVHIFGPNVINEVTVGLRHDSEGFIPSTGVIEGLSREKLNYTAPQLFTGNNALGTIPRVTGWTGVGGTAANINWLDRWGMVGNDYILPSIGDNVSFNRGAHTYKAGFYFEHMRNGEAPGGNWSGTFDFSSTGSGASNFTSALGNTGFPYANALLGNFNSYTEASSRPHTNLAITLLQWYGQDQWKVNRRLTLNYGLRVGYHTQWYQRDKLASDFDPLRFDSALVPVLYQPFCVGGTPPIGTACSKPNQRAVNPLSPGTPLTNTLLVGTFVKGVGNPNDGLALLTDFTVAPGFKLVAPFDWEPRVGFAWDVTGRGRTVLRAMGGVYHSPRYGGGTTGGNLVNNPPFQRTVTISQNSIGNLATLANQCVTDSQNCPALQSPSAVNAVEIISNTPTTYNYSLGFQQDIGFKTVMEVSYVGSQSRHLGERRNINGVPDGARFLDLHPENRNPFSTTSAKADNFLRRYQGFADINTVMYTGTSNYNALQVQLSRRYTKNFQYGVAYTWSKTLDYANDDSSDVFLSRPYRQFNHGPADFDQAHIFTVNYIWDIPSLGRLVDNGFVKAVFGGWQVSGITSLVSGKPKTMGTGTGLNWTYSGGLTDYTGGEVNARPNMTCDPNQGATGVTDKGVPFAVNASCFARPTTRGEIGNLPRNSLRLPGIINSDLAVFKNMHIRERTNVQFRWEAYNVLNHTNFRDIDGSMTFDVNGVQTNKRFGAPISVRPARVMQGSLRVSF